MPTAEGQLDKEQALAILSHLNTKDLQGLLDDDSRLDQLVRDNAQIKALDAEKQTIVASNKSLSEHNLSREPRLSQGKERLSCLHQQLQDSYKSVNDKKNRVDANSSNTSMEEALALLKTAAESLELESETLSEQFLDGNLSIETFLESYIEKRTVAHMRKIKAEKMMELMRNKPGQPSAASPSHWQMAQQAMPMPGAYPARAAPQAPRPGPPMGPYPGYGPPPPGSGYPQGAPGYMPPSPGYPPGGPYSMQPRSYVPRR